MYSVLLYINSKSAEFTQSLFCTR